VCSITCSSGRIPSVWHGCGSLRPFSSTRLSSSSRPLRSDRYAVPILYSSRCVMLWTHSGGRSYVSAWNLENEWPMDSRQKCRFRTFYAGIGKGGCCANREKNSSETPGNLAGIVQNGKRLSRHSTWFRSCIGTAATKAGLEISREPRPVQTAELCIWGL